MRGRSVVYHCMSRTVNGERLFGPSHREVFRKMMIRASEFSGVRVITYCLMENHFHILVEVDSVNDPSDEELVRRFRALYPEPGPYQPVSAERLEEMLRQGGAEAERFRAVLLARMGSVSEFMKTLKQRFSVWFNGVHRRYGPLWSDRFKSVLVEGDSYALETVAAYIDLNPVRAGIVVDPKDYPYCGYGRAMASGEFEREGIRGLSPKRTMSVRGYRKILLGKAGMAAGGGDFVDDSEVIEKPEGEGVPRRSGSLLSTVRHFTHGKVLGSEGFVRRALEEFAVFREVATRRRSPVTVGGLEGLYSGTRVRRRKTCQVDLDSV